MATVREQLKRRELYFTVWSEDKEDILYAGNTIFDAAETIGCGYDSATIANAAVGRKVGMWALDFRKVPPPDDLQECWEGGHCPYHDLNMYDRPSLYGPGGDAWYCCVNQYGEELTPWEVVKQLINDVPEDLTEEEALLWYLEGFDTVEISSV